MRFPSSDSSKEMRARSSTNFLEEEPASPDHFPHLEMSPPRYLSGGHEDPSFLHPPQSEFPLRRSRELEQGCDERRSLDEEENRDVVADIDSGMFLEPEKKLNSDRTALPVSLRTANELAHSLLSPQGLPPVLSFQNSADGPPLNKPLVKSVSESALFSCACKKTKCLRLYCECFAKGETCTARCRCLACLNREDFSELRQLAAEEATERNSKAFEGKIESISERDVPSIHARGCNCRKTNCSKKYCECFQAGVNCSVRCSCVECSNHKVEIKGVLLEQGKPRKNSKVKNSFVKVLLETTQN